MPSTLTADLVSSAIGFSNKDRFLQLKFSLNTAVDRVSDRRHKIGELVLIYDENLEFIDESWILDIDSPALKI